MKKNVPASGGLPEARFKGRVEGQFNGRRWDYVKLSQSQQRVLILSVYGQP